MNISLQSSQGDCTNLRSIKGLRLQPLIDLKKGEPIGWEVLSWLEHQDVEVWFSSLSAESHLAIFMWQVDEVLKCDGEFWLNLPVRILCNPKYVLYISRLHHQNRLTVELQDPENIMLLDSLEKLQLKTGVQILRKAGWSVWLDDVTFKIAQKLPGTYLAVDGIKIDRKEMANEVDLLNLIQYASDYTGHFLAEGIENKHLFERAKKLGIDIGQGYLWPEEKIAINIPELYVSLARQWFDCERVQKNSQKEIYINATDKYIRQGLIYLLWDMNKSSFINGKPSCVKLCHNADKADVIINEHKPGDYSFECILPSTSKKDTTQHNKKCHIFLYKDHKHTPKILCPSVSSFLCYDDSISLYRDVVINSVSYSGQASSKATSELTFAACLVCPKRKLTTREKEIIYMMAKGTSSKTIAFYFGCTNKVVGAHKRSLMRKLHIINDADFTFFLNRIANNSTSV